MVARGGRLVQGAAQHKLQAFLQLLEFRISNTPRDDRVQVWLREGAAPPSLPPRNRTAPRSESGPRPASGIEPSQAPGRPVRVQVWLREQAANSLPQGARLGGPVTSGRPARRRRRVPLSVGRRGPRGTSQGGPIPCRARKSRGGFADAQRLDWPRARTFLLSSPTHPLPLRSESSGTGFERRPVAALSVAPCPPAGDADRSSSKPAFRTMSLPACAAPCLH